MVLGIWDFEYVMGLDLTKVAYLISVRRLAVLIGVL